LTSSRDKSRRRRALVRLASRAEMKAADQPHLGFLHAAPTLPPDRFRPSPPLRSIAHRSLHVGSARTALLNWLFVQKYGGKFLLRSRHR